MRRKSPPKKARFLIADDLKERGLSFDCVMLAAAMASNKKIRRETGLTDGQISRRLRTVGISRLAIRDGKSPFFDFVWNRVRSGDMDARVMSHVRKHL